MNLFNEDNEDEEDDYPEEDIAVCANCEGQGCSSCDYDGVVDLNWVEPDGTN